MRRVGAVRARGDEDRMVALLELVVGGLPPSRAAWGAAMLGELHGAPDARARRRFVLGCVGAAVRMRARAAFAAADRGAPGARTVALGVVVGALALAVYGVARYQAMRGGGAAAVASAGLVATLAGYGLCAWALVRGTSPAIAEARRRGALAGVVVAAAWLAVLAPPVLRQWVLVPLVVALLCPLGLAARTLRAGLGGATAAAAALASGLVGGLLVFVVWASTTYLRGGRPYDPQLVRDFHHSAAHDLVAYAVADRLGSAGGLLVVVPVVSLAAGLLAGLVVARPRVRSPA